MPTPKAAAESPGRRRDVQHRPELLLGRAHLRARARCTTPSSSTSWPPSPASSAATRWTPATYIGAITRAPQLDVLEAQVADARARGATLRCGGQRLPGPGNWFAPTVFTDVNHTMELMREESFGPIIGIQKVGSDDEAVALMNDTRYGLTAGVYTRDEARRANAAGARQRRQRLLELLRPRQPAPAVVGPWRFGHRPDAVDATASRPSRGPRPGTCAAWREPRRASPAGAVRPRPHAARRRQRRAVVRFPDATAACSTARSSRRATRRWNAATVPAASARTSSARFYVVDARRPSPRGVGSRCAASFLDTRDRAAHRAGGACIAAAPSRRRRSAGDDHRDQPLHHRADRRGTSASST